jgi:nucleoside-diphosphate-sugar epimerase
MPTWLVTGGTGYLGLHVLSALHGREAARVVALGRSEPPPELVHAVAEVDLERTEGLPEALAGVRPDVVIHAAGRTPPGEPASFYRANTLATVHLLDALAGLGRRCRVVLVGSAAELGPVGPEALPVSEDHPCRPADAYGLSKWLATCAGLAARPPLEVVSARVFNPVGPGQPPGQAFGRFAARLIANPDGPLDVGDLDARRDFVDVRDVARGLVALADRGRPGLVYNVGTGHSQRVGDGLARLIQRSGARPDVRPDAGQARPTGPRESRADIGRIVAHTGWWPEIPFERSLDDLWDQAAAGPPLPLTG